MLRKSSIRTKLIYTFVVVILVTIVIFELIFTYGIRTYYYTNIEQVLIDRLETTLEVYDTYLGYESIGSKAKFILENESVPNYVEAQVLDLKGGILESTSRFKDKTHVSTEDFIKASLGSIATWRGKNPETGERIMSISAPLYQGGEINGILRYITSIEAVDMTISGYLLYAYLIGFIVLLVVLYLSFIMSNRIVHPIYELKEVADSIATGDLSVRAKDYEKDEIGELAETINYMVDEINKTEKLKHDFISSISHELRTPLTSIKGWSETILTGDIENVEETKLGLEIISRESDRLYGLVENLLDFSKLEADRMQLVKASFDLRDLIERVFNQYYVILKQHDIKSEIISTERNLSFYGDRNRLKQVFINILDNAIKYTPEGGVIWCKIESVHDGVVISVQDNGAGIPQAHLKKIVERFYKADPNVSGSGLGLAITKRIIELHSGVLTIESEWGKGTCVVVRLPQLKEE